MPDRKEKRIFSTNEGKNRLRILPDKNKKRKFNLKIYRYDPTGKTIQMTSARTYVLEGNKKCDQLNPKELMLLAGVTCAGMTAMAIMEKERVSPTRFELSISGELDTETVQSSSVFKSFRIVYNVQCECENDQMKVSRAINLAHDKHCGGVQMLRKIAPVADEIAIVNTK